MISRGENHKLQNTNYNTAARTLYFVICNLPWELIDAVVKTPEKKSMERRSLTREGFRFWLRPCQEGDGDAIYAAADESRARVGQWMDWLTSRLHTRRRA